MTCRAACFAGLVIVTASSASQPEPIPTAAAARVVTSADARPALPDSLPLDGAATLADTLAALESNLEALSAWRARLAAADADVLGELVDAARESSANGDVEVASILVTDAAALVRSRTRP